MGLFSKFNVKAVDRAYKDIAAYNLITRVIVRSFEASSSSTSTVDIAQIVDSAAHEIANELGSLARGGLELASGIQRLSQVTSWLKNLTSSELGPRPYCTAVAKGLAPHIEFLTTALFEAAHRGYLDLSIGDVGYLTEISNRDIQTALSQLNDRDLAHNLGNQMYDAIIRGSSPTADALERKVEQVVKDMLKKNNQPPSSSEPARDDGLEIRAAIHEIENSTDEDAARFKWLEGEYFYLQRKKARGEQLDEYELGLIRQYQSLVRHAQKLEP